MEERDISKAGKIIITQLKVMCSFMSKLHDWKSD